MADEDVSFPATHIHEPTADHTHTAIMLHGRGSNGPEFAQEFFSMKLSGSHQSLASRFPGWRWLFPSAGKIWNTTFEEEEPAWFDIASLTDITRRQDLQMDGIAKSVHHILEILEEEVERLECDETKVVLGGISMGSVIGLWTLLCQNRPSVRLGAFVGASGWLPLAAEIEEWFPKEESDPTESTSTSGSEESEALAFVKSMIGGRNNQNHEHHSLSTLLRTPVFLGHGTDDAYVDVSLGRQARDVLTKLGFTVQWREYVGAELEGHWLKAPEEMDDIAAVLEAVEKNGGSGRND
ncbi:hypothetical protein W97_02161 [Coniosporium apollinis CBS 100218]|uniref:Phospholipase/carboxylesterase/thioesterase domain-containing protein n=1 Tax=Coniosporium apollinis (strain CBS 100218) TaxID=1168221 RepID=R7YLZ5_CONA1|nr:uncharacterized protein W97_02161 [Coniosporium apollinis CBS 100218]EON62935.1 hypothetical protein W97_02161 [Coniosporium apollinis CBS 100218]